MTTETKTGTITLIIGPIVDVHFPEGVPELQNTTDKSKEVAKSLTLVYNKERQASITAEVAEITGGMEAMK